MTLHASDGLPLVLLERFEQVTIAIDCKDDEGTLDLVFGKKDAFDYAKEQWGYVNDADEGRFLLIANNDGCGTDEQRQPYMYVTRTIEHRCLHDSLFVG